KEAGATPFEGKGAPPLAPPPEEPQRPQAPKPKPGRLMPPPPSALAGTQAISDQAAARFKEARATPFEGKGAPLPGQLPSAPEASTVPVSSTAAVPVEVKAARPPTQRRPGYGTSFLVAMGKIAPPDASEAG